MNKQKKILALSLVLVVVIGLTWWYFFYKPTAQQLAESLGLYTGDPLLDNLLNNIISTALASGGAISSGNLEWELTEAANRMKTPLSAPEDYWRIDGKLYPAGALLVTIDTTHDYYAGSPDVEGGPSELTQANINRYDELIEDEGMTPEEAADYYSADLGQTYTVQEFEQARQILAGVNPGEAYIPQTSLNQIWELFNDAKRAFETGL
jgi:hypothetical protein